MSNLNAFLVLIQQGQFFSPAGTEVLFSAFGDCAFNLGHQCIQSYYQAFEAGAQLTNAQKRCNAAMRSARITVEKNYAMVSNLSAFVRRGMATKLQRKGPMPLSSCVCVPFSPTAMSA
jgi:hypothetical protein